jgi:hypothetical protein
MCYRNSYSMAIRLSEAEERKTETCKMACYADDEVADDVDEDEL